MDEFFTVATDFDQDRVADAGLDPIITFEGDDAVEDRSGDPHVDVCGFDGVGGVDDRVFRYLVVEAGGHHGEARTNRLAIEGVGGVIVRVEFHLDEILAVGQQNLSFEFGKAFDLLAIDEQMHVALVRYRLAVDGEPVPNEGHMHLLIDGQKVERFTELERQVLLPDGENFVEVELNANNHAAYTLDGEPIRAGLTVVATSLDDQVPEDAVVDAPDAIEAADVDVRITASVLDGVVTLEGDDRVEASVGDTVLIEVSGDSEELIHLHGFNIFQDLTPDTPAVIEFVPEAPGRFEIEVERTGAFIAELVVS